MTVIVNGLAATPHRRAFLKAVNERGRIVLYRSWGHVYDKKNSTKVTARLKEAHAAGWVEAVPVADLWPSAEPPTRVVYYRLTDLGRTAMGGNR